MSWLNIITMKDGKVISYKSFFSFLLILGFSFPLQAQAAKFECSIQSVLRLNDAGAIVTHGWSANYLNRKFTVDKDSGKVLNTTALKVRLSNYNKESVPHILDYGDMNNSYKAVTLFEDKGGYAVLEINDVDKKTDMPFLYQTNIGMILTGKCNEIGSG